MKTFYKITCVVTSILFVYLFVQLLFFSDSFVEDLGLQPTVASVVLARRTSMFMLGIAMLTFLSRNLLEYKVRLVVCLSVGITLIGLSIVGMFELISETVNSSMLVAIISESVLFICYATILVKYKEAKS